MNTYQQRCTELAALGELYVAPNPMVGAVLVSQDGQILAEGWHERYGEVHAEVNCFKHFDEKFVNTTPPLLNDCTLYVSLEPCSHYGKTPPCADLIINRGVGRVVVAMLDPNPLVAGKGVDKLQKAGIKVEVDNAEWARICREQNKRFLCLHENHRPYIILKWAQTGDGFIAPSNQTERLKISTPSTRQIVHKMRAENMAIMVATNTALKDNPKLTVSHWVGRNPIRILLDRHSRIPKSYNIYSADAPTIVYDTDTTWKYILDDLAQRNIHSLLVEGGSQLINYIFSTGIYDEVHVEINPRISIKEGISAPTLPNGLRLTKQLTIDGNTLLEYRR